MNISSIPFVKKSSASDHLRSAGILLATLYIILLGTASFCMFAHAAPDTQGTHHSQDSTNHSVLCMWACQVGSHSSIGQISPTLDVRPIVLTFPLFLIHLSLARKTTFSAIRSRAPPWSILSL